MKGVSVITDPRVIDHILRHLRKPSCRARDHSSLVRRPNKSGPGTKETILPERASSTRRTGRPPGHGRSPPGPSRQSRRQRYFGPISDSVEPDTSQPGIKSPVTGFMPVLPHASSLTPWIKTPIGLRYGAAGHNSRPTQVLGGNRRLRESPIDHRNLFNNSLSGEIDCDIMVIVVTVPQFTSEPI